MAYICENCGVVADDASAVCNPVNEEYKKKSCSSAEEEICTEKIAEMKYSCTCGNISANPQHLCNPTKLV
jgi:hypothetical protein